MGVLQLDYDKILVYPIASIEATECGTVALSMWNEGSQHQILLVATRYESKLFQVFRV
jgi:hypothetical protein